MKIEGTGEIRNLPTLYVSNHNIGALIESHSILFLIDDILNGTHSVFGFTHPSLFRIIGMKQYFEWIGAIPATYEMAKNVFSVGQSILIFPGGNKQATRSIFQYKRNSFRDAHGWAKIAKENCVDVVPITFKGTHFLNPVLYQGQFLSKMLVIPWLLGVKWLPISLGQIFLSLCTFLLLRQFSFNLPITVTVSLFVFCLTPLVIFFPFKIHMKFHPRIKSDLLSQKELENQVGKIMDQIFL